MQEKTKLFFGGIYLIAFVVLGLVFISFIQVEKYQNYAAIAWAIGILSGVKIGSWFDWMRDFTDRMKKENEEKI